ncbi:MAG: 3-deoxy-manno-octulosonate cytidylyltransferase [Magnetococcales bacterium]|nr:3-deoxy-manno-octulosonate cytidylyltransferase [Magnetococcales bacterium]
MKRRIIVVIPARYASTRLPGKPLLEIAGKPMIQHVYERAAQAQVAEVLVATDDQRIFTAVEGFGGRVVMTSEACRSGTDRVAEAVTGMEADVVVNVQGDEPMLHHAMIDQAATPFREESDCVMSTLSHALTSMEELVNSDVVKVACRLNGDALTFSRAPIPFIRDRFGGALPTAETPFDAADPLFKSLKRHIGLYAYRSDFLQRFAAWEPTPLEQLERLEQLRVLEHGFPIRVVETAHAIIGVDTPADLERVRALLQ